MFGLGPFFFDGNLNGDTYFNFLQNYLVFALIEQFTDPNNPEGWGISTS